jgi:hypothetical protein
MTLLISALGDDAVIQVSDRRFTHSDGSIYTDVQNKVTCVSAADAFFSIGYTGLGVVSGTSTDRWLTNVLSRFVTFDTTCEQIVNHLQDRMTAAFASAYGLGDRRSTTFVASGYLRNRAICILFSNMEDPATGKRLRSVQSAFSSHSMIRNDESVHRFGCVIAGREQAVSEELRTAIKETIRKRYLNRTPEDRRDVLVDVLRRASSHAEQGHWIGKTLNSIILRRDGGITCCYHDESNSRIAYFPNFVNPRFSAMDVYVSTSEDVRPPWTKKRPHA